MDWLAPDAPELRALDGAEVVRSEALVDDEAAARLHDFFGRGSFTAIRLVRFSWPRPDWLRAHLGFRARAHRAGSDRRAARRPHRRLRPGSNLRESRTHRAAAEVGLPNDVPPWPLPGLLGWISRIGILVVLAAILAFNRWSRALRPGYGDFSVNDGIRRLHVSPRERRMHRAFERREVARQSRDRGSRLEVKCKRLIRGLTNLRIARCRRPP
jgi:hypothetical protein